MQTKNKLANPGPLGLMGFGMTTILLNVCNAGFLPMSVVIISMGLFYGGIAQVIAGLLEYKKGNTFGLTAFISYGLFWISFVFILLLPHTHLVDVSTGDKPFIGIYLLLWAIFTLFMLIATCRHKPCDGGIRFVFASLFVLFLLLAFSNLVAGGIVLTIAGYVGIICGASAIFVAMRDVIRESDAIEE